MKNIKLIEIIFFVTSLEIGGTENQVFLLMKNINKDKFKVSVFPIFLRGKLKEKFINEDIKIEFLKYKSFFIRNFLMIIKLIFIRKSIIHFYLPLSYLIYGPLCLIINKHTLIMSRRSSNVYQNGKPFVKFVEKFLHNKITSIIGNSNAVINELLNEKVNSEKLHLIYNSLDLKKFKSPVIKKSSSRLTRITCVANLYEYKGYFDLINAIKIIKSEIIEDFELIIIGRNQGIKNKLKEKVIEYKLEKIIKFLGEKNNIIPFLHNSDIGVLASHQEGFSNSILEYMAAGLPIVVTNIGGNTEAVIDEHNGFVVPIKDPYKLACALKKLILNPSKRNTMGLASREIVEKKFNLKLLVNSHEKLYSKVF